MDYIDEMKKVLASGGRTRDVEERLAERIRLRERFKEAREAVEAGPGLEDKITYRDLKRAAVENSYDAMTTQQELRVLDHLFALAGTDYVTRLADMVCGKGAE